MQDDQQKIQFLQKGERRYRTDVKNKLPSANKGDCRDPGENNPDQEQSSA